LTQKILNKLIYRITEVACNAAEGHVPSALSILDIVWVVYNNFINVNLIKNNSKKRDIFILSKGHGCLAQYAVLEEKGVFPKNFLDSFCKYNSKFGGHPDANKIKGIECSTGSLGHGFPFAAGNDGRKTPVGDWSVMDGVTLATSVSGSSRHPEDSHGLHSRRGKVVSG
jgi:transketolase